MSLIGTEHQGAQSVNQFKKSFSGIMKVLAIVGYLITVLLMKYLVLEVHTIYCWKREE